jgi:oxygen-independent coproporphyrinogen-3 oxidase
MIGLIQNKTIYEYDIRSLILAFLLGVKIELTDQVDSIYDFVLDVFYGNEQVSLKLYQRGILSKEIVLTGPYENKKLFKNQMKLGIYQLFSETLHRKLPWGTLTGIRPTKIVFDELDRGMTQEEIVTLFQTEYAASAEKAKLCVDVVRKEQELLEKFPYRDGYSLYVGIPFCPSTCLYCSFTSYPIGIWKDQVQTYLDALLKEAAFVKDIYKDKPLQTMYIGGGTPTSLDAGQLDELLSRLEELFDFSKVLEITVEAGRPDSITEDKLKVLRDHHISRISINPQTMNEDTLRLIGRNHSVEQVKDTFAMARDLGFDNINMDTICGLPEERMDHLRKTYEALKNWHRTV